MILHGTPSPACAAALHAAVRDAAGAGTDVLLDCSAADRIDACTLQLVVALGREVGAGGHQLVTTMPPPDAALVALAGVEWPSVAEPAWLPDEPPVPEAAPVAADRPRRGGTGLPRKRRAPAARKVHEGKGSET